MPLPVPEWRASEEPDSGWGMGKGTGKDFLGKAVTGTATSTLLRRFRTFAAAEFSMFRT